MFQPKWFKEKAEDSLVGQNGMPVAHLFFDVNPEFSMDNRLVNLVMTTSAESQHRYHLDLVSGQRHYAYSYCKQNDVWGEQSGSFERPSFSIGHIPRMLDQLGEPQKVVVFSDPKKVRNTLTYNFFRVRLIGAYVERTCPEGNCQGQSNWLSRLVFIAVDPDDKAYEKVRELQDFIQFTSWPRFKATLENIDGRNFAGVHTYPHLKVGAPLTFGEAFEFFKGHSIFMSDKELTKIHAGCTALYDRLWSEVGQERQEDKAVRNSEELKAKLKLLKELRAKGTPVGFAKRLQAFTQKYFDEVTTCQKFVYAGNLNRQPEKFWFLSLMNLFFRLHRDGYYYDCRHGAWQKNSYDNRGELVYDLKKEVMGCDEGDFDSSMSYMPNFLESLKNSPGGYYKYVDYDNHAFGTHNKLYSWVKVPIRKFECGRDPNEKIRKESRVFPEDVKWKNRSVKDLEKELKVIY